MINSIKFVFILLIGIKSVLAEVPVIGGPCQGCELVFVGMPEALKSHSRIAPVDEKGEALRLTGIVYDIVGEPVEGVIVYAYQTDDNGVYPKGATWHGSLRGWAITDYKGRYTFDTIRPKAYPNRKDPQHIHLHVIEPSKGTYYIDDLTFADDPLVTPEFQQTRKCRGACGEDMPIQDEFGVWSIRRDITLGVNIPNY